MKTYTLPKFLIIVLSLLSLLLASRIAFDRHFAEAEVGIILYEDQDIRIVQISDSLDVDEQDFIRAMADAMTVDLHSKEDRDRLALFLVQYFIQRKIELTESQR